MTSKPSIKKPFAKKPSNVPMRKPSDETPRAPRAVHVSCASQEGGRVAVTVSVDPAEDLDASGGVFVDVVLAGTDRATRRAEVAPTIPPRTMARPAIRSVAKAAPLLAHDPSRLHPPAQAPVASAVRGKRTFTSHLIAPGRQIATGHAETFRSEIVLTSASPTGLSWFVRGRFATLGDDDLRSTWVRVHDPRISA